MHLEINFSVNLSFLFSTKSIIAVILFNNSEKQKRIESLIRILEHPNEVLFLASLSPFSGIIKVQTSHFNETCLSIYRISTWKY